jgi:outer membrane murein-binding lipoprotein Lpp
MQKFAFAALAAGALLVSGCGDDADSGEPTAAENKQLDQAAEELDTSADSLTADDMTLGNGEESAESGDVLVADRNAVGSETNAQ